VYNLYLRTTNSGRLEATEEYREVVGPCNSNLGVYLLSNSGFRIAFTDDQSKSASATQNVMLTYYVSYTTAFRNQEQNELRDFCNTQGCCKTYIGKATPVDMIQCVRAQCNGNPNQYGVITWDSTNADRFTSSDVFSCVPGGGSGTSPVYVSMSTCSVSVDWRGWCD
jgi:hypothetical protein